ncbi:hypothetical protein MLD38_035278 [Melastoma candidum]|uniref:Uncharacterized protein n=1 Tax=Melastoma candidum TaxID=119954 RepID=A0ACB9MC92_9MYRT|nr:hypothetical protein MLD38_035278 [Melastoma candidum]
MDGSSGYFEVRGKADSDRNNNHPPGRRNQVGWWEDGMPAQTSDQQFLPEQSRHWHCHGNRQQNSPKPMSAFLS